MKSALSVPVDNKPKKGKSFSKEAEKLEPNDENIKNSVYTYKSIDDLIHRRFTFGMKNKFKIISDIKAAMKKKDHRGTFTTNVPPLIRFKNSKNDLSSDTKNFIEGRYFIGNFIERAEIEEHSNEIDTNDQKTKSQKEQSRPPTSESNESDYLDESKN